MQAHAVFRFHEYVFEFEADPRGVGAGFVAKQVRLKNHAGLEEVNHGREDRVAADRDGKQVEEGAHLFSLV